jgi:monovalent cation/hydrogen antiporter
MESLQTIFILIFAAVLLIGIAQKIRVPYPIALVVGGAAIGFIPGLHAVNFDPILILVIVLPPILYYAAFGISFREFRQNWREIFSLALGLVVFTTFVIGIIFKLMFPQFPWALAFAFGAIVSPPDATAATTILKRFSITSRLVTLLEGESLINDASAIVLYKLALTALLSGTFSFIDGGIEFTKDVVGGVAIGFATGFLFQLFARRYLEPVVGVVFSFTIPYMTYLAAYSLGVSGVLAVVVNGLIGARVLLTHHSSLRRVLGYAAWDIFIILLNCFVFILIGLQLRPLTNLMTIGQIVLYTAYGFLIFVAMLTLRMLWVYTKAGRTYVKALKKPKSALVCSQIMREAVVVGWSGMRGIVSLAIALALPMGYP